MTVAKILKLRIWDDGLRPKPSPAIGRFVAVHRVGGDQHNMHLRIRKIRFLEQIFIEYDILGNSI